MRERQTVEKQTSKVINATSEKMIVQKFAKDYANYIGVIFRDHEEPNQKLNYIKFKELAIMMGLMTEAQANADSHERVLLFDLWRLL